MNRPETRPVLAASNASGRVGAGLASSAVTSRARRVASDPFFLASALAAYQQRHGLEDGALAGLLGCAPAVLTQLQLCRRPGADSRGTVEEDVATIAQRFGIDPAALRRAVEEAPDMPVE